MMIYDSSKVMSELANIKEDIEEIFGDTFNITDDRSHQDYDVFIIESSVQKDIFIHFKYDIKILNLRPYLEQITIIFSIPKITFGVYNLSYFVLINDINIKNIRLWTINKLIELYD